MNKKKSKKRPPKNASFEESFEQLKDIVSQLEDGNLSLSESLEVYESGVKNLNNCYRALEQVQKRIELLVDIDDDGNLVTRDFDDAATSEPARKATRHADDETHADFDHQDEDEEGNDDVDDSDRLF